MRNFLLIIGCFVVLATTFFFIQIFPRLGKSPSVAQLLSYRGSKQFDEKNTKFVNPNEGEITEYLKKNMKMGPMLINYIFPKNIVTPPRNLPEVEVDLEKFMLNSDELKFIWLGHSTFLAKLSGKVLLFDPVFSRSASPDGFMTPRFQPPVIGLSELPEIDYIVISHDHYDHLDADTVKFFADKRVQFITPLGIGSHLRHWGVEADRITELDWWQEYTIEGIDFIATPSQHFSGRLFPHENTTLWASWVIRNKRQSFYFSGDSGYGPHLKEIGDRYGPFDVSFVENGQYDLSWRPVHMLPEESAQAYFDLKSKKYIPVHWGMFNISMHNWYDPIEEIERLSAERNIDLLTPQIGEIIVVPGTQSKSKWWKPLIKKN